MLNLRSRTLTTAPGIDLLAPSPPPALPSAEPGGGRALVTLDGGAIVLRYCLPAPQQSLNLAYLIRTRTPGVSGTNLLRFGLPQTDCQPDGAAPPQSRCWSGRSELDAVIDGIDETSTGVWVPTGYVLELRNVTVACNQTVSDECVQRFTAVGCLLLHLRGFNGSTPTSASDASSSGPSGSGSGSGASRTSPDVAQLAPPPSAAPGALPPTLSPQAAGTEGGAAGGGGGGTAADGPQDGVLAGAVAGAVGGALLLVLAAFLAVRFARSRSQQQQPCLPAPTKPDPAAPVHSRDSAGSRGSDTLSLSLSPLDQAAGVESAGEDGPTGAGSPAAAGADGAAPTALPEGPEEDGRLHPGGALGLGFSTEPCRLPVVSLLTPFRSDLPLNVHLCVAGGDTPTAPATGTAQLRPAPAPPLLGGLSPLGAAAVAGAAAAGLAHPSPGNAAGVGTGPAAADIAPTCFGGAAGLGPAGGGSGGADRDGRDSSRGGSAGDGDGASGVVEEVTLLPTVLGRGAFGKVHVGLYQGQRVAVKVWTMDSWMAAWALDAAAPTPGAPTPGAPATPAAALGLTAQQPPPAPSPAPAPLPAALDLPSAAGASPPTDGAAPHAEGPEPSGHASTYLSCPRALPETQPARGPMPTAPGPAAPAAFAGVEARAGADSAHGSWAGGDGRRGAGGCKDGGAAEVGGAAAGPAAVGQGGAAAGGALLGYAAAEGQAQGQGPAVHLQDAACERFLSSVAAEVAALGRCQHPGIVRLLAANLELPRPCLVFELMETSLDKLIYGGGGGSSSPEGGPRLDAGLLPLPKVLHIALGIAEPLAYLHPFVCHRDIKPANVLINEPDSPFPVVKLTDFGLSRVRYETMATLHPEAGTPSYVAPECYTCGYNLVSHAADVYALGVCVWSMLSGERPWQGLPIPAIAYKVAVLGERPPLAHLPPGRCPPPLQRLLAACWDSEPRRRPAAAEVANELAGMLQQLSPDASVPHRRLPAELSRSPHTAAPLPPRPSAAGDAAGPPMRCASGPMPPPRVLTTSAAAGAAGGESLGFMETAGAAQPVGPAFAQRWQPLRLGPQDRAGWTRLSEPPSALSCGGGASAVGSANGGEGLGAGW
ncbi:hypothetical protein HYH03_011860 [Edaphochlamys debaryana]|uniref:Protein kinase domain-containing protein n=1 Tax=Edaphochlamys debaryana TaxID=47281 RepID=A0A835Y285_9CHLO|nr:hypothetical protein HYH03_011860 [Edaphochlamys debaryana]|eukprot:KAG2489754.1 hypothetical protein HYH03_011860 [Edaphochlamys debaryana]